MEREKLIIDASVSRKWYNKEQYTEQAIEIRDLVKKRKVLLIEPDLFIYETIAGIKKCDEFTTKEKTIAIKDLIQFIYRIENWNIERL